MYGFIAHHVGFGYKITYRRIPVIRLPSGKLTIEARALLKEQRKQDRTAILATARNIAQLQNRAYVTTHMIRAARGGGTLPRLTPTTP